MGRIHNRLLQLPIWPTLWDSFITRGRSQHSGTDSWVRQLPIWPTLWDSFITCGRSQHYGTDSHGTRKSIFLLFFFLPTSAHLCNFWPSTNGTMVFNCALSIDISSSFCWGTPLPLFSLASGNDSCLLFHHFFTLFLCAIRAGLSAGSLGWACPAGPWS